MSNLASGSNLKAAGQLIQWRQCRRDRDLVRLSLLDHGGMLPAHQSPAWWLSCSAVNGFNMPGGQWFRIRGPAGLSMHP